MKVMLLAAAGLAMAIASGCSDDAPSSPASSTPTAAASASTPPQPDVVVDGKSYPMAYYECADKLWSDRLAGWNGLAQAKRDGWPGGFVGYMKSKGWPTTQPATLEAASTRKVCPAS